MRDPHDRLEDALRRLGREVLDEEVPEKLRRVLRDHTTTPRDRQPDADQLRSAPTPPRSDHRG